MTTKETVAVLLIIFGLMWIVSPILRWAVMGESGSFAFRSLVVVVGAAFLIAGIVALKMWKE